MVRRKRKKPYRMRAHKGVPKRQIHFKRIYNALRDQGYSHKDAMRIAAAKINQYRAEHGELISDVGRRAWYPGKKKSHKGRHKKAG